VICSSELAGYKRSVLYSRLPAQFVSLLFAAQLRRGETMGLAVTAAMSLTNVLLFMEIIPSGSTSCAENLSLEIPKPSQLYTTWKRSTLLRMMSAARILSRVRHRIGHDFL